MDPQTLSSIEIAEPRHRIGNITGGFMFIVAVGIDSLQGMLTSVLFTGLVLNTFVSIFAWLLFFVWFKLNGVNFWDGAARKLIVFLGTAFIEIIPVINNLPAWTFMVIFMIIIIKTADSRFNKKRNRAIEEFEKYAQATS